MTYTMPHTRTDEPACRRLMAETASRRRPELCKMANIECLDCPLPVCVHDLKCGTNGGSNPQDSLKSFVWTAHHRAVKWGMDAPAECLRAMLNWFDKKQDLPSIVRARQELAAIREGPRPGVNYQGPLASGAEAW